MYCIRKKTDNQKVLLFLLFQRRQERHKAPSYQLNSLEDDGRANRYTIAQSYNASGKIYENRTYFFYNYNYYDD